jgi:predicted metal-dependent phosphoesterase TrpH
MAVVADLHVHTTNSDGSLAVEELPTAARRARLDAVAVTDHDRFHPVLDDPVSTRDGLTLIHGIELRVEAGDQRVDLLGYGVDPTAALREEVDRLQRDRIERGRAIIERVEDRLGVNLDVEPREGLGRHVSRPHSPTSPPSLHYRTPGASTPLSPDAHPKIQLPYWNAMGVTLTITSAPFERSLSLR